MITYRQAYSTREVAGLFGVSTQHVRRLIKAEELAAFKAGAHILRISEQAIADYLQRHGSTKSGASDVKAS